MDCDTDGSDRIGVGSVKVFVEGIKDVQVTAIMVKYHKKPIRS